MVVEEDRRSSGFFHRHVKHNGIGADTAKFCSTNRSVTFRSVNVSLINTTAEPQRIRTASTR